MAYRAATRRTWATCIYRTPAYCVCVTVSGGAGVVGGLQETTRRRARLRVATRVRFAILMAIHERLEGRLSSERDINHGSFSHSCLPWSMGPCPDRYPGRWLRASSRPRHWRILRITRSLSFAPSALVFYCLCVSIAMLQCIRVVIVPRVLLD